jgi:hypothetical protein
MQEGSSSQCQLSVYANRSDIKNQNQTYDGVFVLRVASNTQTGLGLGQAHLTVTVTYDLVYFILDIGECNM